MICRKFLKTSIRITLWAHYTPLNEADGISNRNLPAIQTRKQSKSHPFIDRFAGNFRGKDWEGNEMATQIVSSEYSLLKN